MGTHGTQQGHRDRMGTLGTWRYVGNTRKRRTGWGHNGDMGVTWGPGGHDGDALIHGRQRDMVISGTHGHVEDTRIH